MATPLHAGTHGDAPLHYADDGAASADCDLAPYIGPCALLDVRHARGRVEVADIDWDAVEGATRVLLRTYERFPHRAWDSELTANASEVIARLGEMCVTLVGHAAACDRRREGEGKRGAR